MTGKIFDIQKYSLHDGPGIRTLVFMKGCPLRCDWCSNPESQNPECEIGHLPNNCIKCGKCATVCSENAIDATTFHIDRDRCIRCGKCVLCCPVKAKKQIGYEVRVEELLNMVQEDSLFYRNSGGGVTVGGGEPTMQSKFVNQFLKRCKENSIHTCVETCGYAEQKQFMETIEFADLVLFDIKHMNPAIHTEVTGASNDLIIKNARNIDKNKNVIFRVPLIPGINHSEKNLSETFLLAEEIEAVKAVELLPYHDLGEKKYEWIGEQYKLKGLQRFTDKQKDEIKQWIASQGYSIDIQLV